MWWISSPWDDRSLANRFRSSSCSSSTTHFFDATSCVPTHETRFLVEKTHSSSKPNAAIKTSRLIAFEIACAIPRHFPSQKTSSNAWKKSTTPCRFLPPDEPSLRSRQRAASCTAEKPRGRQAPARYKTRRAQPPRRTLPTASRRHVHRRRCNRVRDSTERHHLRSRNDDELQRRNKT